MAQVYLYTRIQYFKPFLDSECYLILEKIVYLYESSSYTEVLFLELAVRTAIMFFEWKVMCTQKNFSPLRKHSRKLFFLETVPRPDLELDEPTKPNYEMLQKLPSRRIKYFPSFILDFFIPAANCGSFYGGTWMYVQVTVRAVNL